VTPPPSSDGSDVHTGGLLDSFEDADEAANDKSKMSFLEHLEELRRRIIYSLYAIAACCAVTFWFADAMNTYMLRYFTQTAGGGKIKLIATQLTEGFMFEFKLVMLAAAVMAAPFLFIQLWLFVAPGLYAKEKKIVVPFVASASLLLGGGVWFGHAIAFPTMVTFFATFNNDFLVVMPQLELIFSFYVKMILGLGLVFEMPMLVFFLARFGIVTAPFLIKHTKYAILLIFILAAVITPTPDMATQFMFAGPMLGLYGISIGVAWLFGKKRALD